MFSATLSDRVYKIRGVDLDQSKLLKIDAVGTTGADAGKIRTRNNFEQGYVVCSADLRFLLLYSFLKKKTA